MAAIQRFYTRVAVVQMNYHPAAILERRSPLEDPLFQFGKPDSLTPHDWATNEKYETRLRALRTRIRDVYNEQLLLRVRAILATCRAWKTRLVVFPEYSIPWEILGGVSDAAGDMVVVAGTHAVERAGRRSEAYSRLGIHEPPEAATSVSPVLHQGRIIGLQAKLNPAKPEQDSMQPGKTWQPIALPDGLPTMGVLICLDFLYGERGHQHEAIVNGLKQSRFLAVPSLTPHYTLDEFAATAWQEARRYGRPVLYANIGGSFAQVPSDKSVGGGSTIYVDVGVPGDLRRFPEAAGYLEKGDEGVIVADVDLGFEHPLAGAPTSTRYADSRPIIPVAEASLVYRSHPAEAAYADLIERLAARMETATDGDVDVLADELTSARRVLLDAGAFPGATARNRRLSRLLSDLDRVQRIGELQKFLREVVLPSRALRLDDLRAGLAHGTANVLFSWSRERTEAGLAPIEQSLRETGDRVAKLDPALWTLDAQDALLDITETLREPEEPSVSKTADAEPASRVVLPEGMNPANLGEQIWHNWQFHFTNRPSDLLKQGWSSLDGQMEEAAAKAGRLHIERGFATHVYRPNIGPLEEAWLLLQATGCDRICAFSAKVTKVARDLQFDAFVLAHVDGKWNLLPHGDVDLSGRRPDLVVAALSSFGIEGALVVTLDVEKKQSDTRQLLERFTEASHQARQNCNDKLKEVSGHFIDPHVIFRGPFNERMQIAGMVAMNSWLEGPHRTMLLLGEFGCGKSTLLANWSTKIWKQVAINDLLPRPVLCNLAGAGATADAEALLLAAAELEDTPANRAALELLIRRGMLLPIFDGFDEMATRLTPPELAGRLSSLLAVAKDGGRVVVSSRDNYFPSDEHLQTTTQQALAQALGGAGSVWRIQVLPFNDDQVKELVTACSANAESGQEAMRKIAAIYPLGELVKRPLMLGMVLSTLDHLQPSDTIARADLYEAYLQRWLKQTDEDVFTHAQKIALAEELADRLWRSGEPSCTPAEIKQSLLAWMQQELTTKSDDLPISAVLLDIFGGSFFVHEGSDRFRFAHKSFLEFFLARSLIRTLPLDPAKALDTKPITREVAAFVGELVRREGDPKRSHAIESLKSWLCQVRTDSSDKVASANALRLLQGLAVWSKDREGWFPEGAIARGVDLTGDDLSGASLIRADLSDATFAGCTLTEVNFTGAIVDRVRFNGARLDRALFNGAHAHEADFTFVAADECQLREADLTGSRFDQGCWTRCDWAGAITTDTHANAVIGPVSSFAPRKIALSRSERRQSPSPQGISARICTGHQGSVRFVAFSPDGRLLASAGNDGSVRLWDVSSGVKLRRFTGHANPVNSLSFSPDGARLASGGADDSVRLWDVASGAEVRRFMGHEMSVMSVTFSPDGARLASASDDKSIRLWDVASGVELRRFKGHDNVVTSVSFGPDGARLASGSRDNSVRLWDVANGAELRSITGHEQSVWSVSFSPDGARLASGSDDRSVRLWDVASGAELRRFTGHGNMVWSVSFSPDGARLASGCADHSVRLWDVSSGQELRRFTGHKHDVSSVSFSPDGARLASGSVDQSVRLWDVASGQELRRFTGYERLVTSVSFSPDGARLASGSDDSTVRLWDVASGAELRRFTGHERLVTSVSFSRDGARLASCSSDNTMRLWDVASGTELRRFTGHHLWVSSVSFSPNGARLATSDLDNAVRLWDLSSGQELRRFTGHTLGVESVSFSPDGARLASGSVDKSVRLWDVASGAELRRFTGHEGGVLSVSFSPDGARLASGSGDQSMRLWDVASGAELRRFTGHKYDVSSVSFSRDGARLASGSVDQSVRLWDVASGQELRRFMGHENGVKSVSFSPDGTKLISAGYDGWIMVWNVATGERLATFEAAGESWLARTAGGYCNFGGDESRQVLAMSQADEPRTLLYFPLGGFRSIMYRPDKVAAALAGDLSGDDLGAELAKHEVGHVFNVPIMPRHVENVPHETPKLVENVHHESLVPSGFTPGPPLRGWETLPGREAKLREAIELIDKRSPVRIIGARRAGKTSVLSTLELRLKGAGHVVRNVSLDGNEIRTKQDLARAIEPELVEVRFAAQALTKRLKSEARPVILLDEIACLHEAKSEVFGWLRNQVQPLAAVVYAGAHFDFALLVKDYALNLDGSLTSDVPKKRVGSSFLNDVPPIELGRLSRDEAESFLRDNMPDDCRNDQVMRWTLERSDCWPFYMHAIGHVLVQAARAGGESRRAILDRAAFDALARRTLLDDWDRVFRERWTELPREAKLLLLRNAGSLPDWSRFKSADQFLLRNLGLGNSTEGWIPDAPFFDWIRHHSAALQRELNDRTP